MKNKLTTSLLILFIIFALTNTSVFARENNNHKLAMLNQSEKDDSTQSGRNKFFFKDIRDSNKFMIKGIIDATTSATLTINSRVINFDNKTKVVGDITTGAYAIIQGTIDNSNYYATKIVITQRFKDKINEDEQHEGIGSAKATSSGLFKGIRHLEGFNISNNVVLNVQNLINYLKNWLSVI